MRHKVLRVSLLLVILLVLGLSASPVSAATFNQITQPDSAYLASTTKIDISGLTNYSNYTSINDGTLTVYFSTSMNKRGPVPTGWSTWSSPPWSESPNPHVLYSNGATSLNMTLSEPVTTFGFELEPNPFSSENYDVDFILMSGSDTIGTISMAVSGSSGARLFAASVTNGSFDKVVINGTADFAIGQVRYAVMISEKPEKPVAKFSIMPAAFGEAPLTIQFKDKSTGDIDSWRWNFDDGERSSGRFPTHTYQFDGVFSASLTVEGPGGKDTKSIDIIVESSALPPIISVRDLNITPAYVYPRQAVTIDANVANDGGSWGSQTMDLMINEQREQSTDVGVAPGTAQPIRFTVYKVNPGKYEVRIGNAATGTFYVLEETPTATPKTGLLAGGELDTTGTIAIVVIGIILIGGIVVAVMLTRRAS